MKCNHCGIKIDVCQYGNPECQQKDTHWYCKTPSCGRGNVGLGCVDPCRVLKIIPSGNYGIGTIVPQTYITYHSYIIRKNWN
jgi:hypothetical protein